MAVDLQLPEAAAIVLRDRTNSDPQQVLVTAMDELVALGVWTVTIERRGLRRRRVELLTSAAGRLPVLVEPLRYVDEVLRRVAAEHDGPFSVEQAARWMVLRGHRSPTEAVRRTIDELVEFGLLERAPVLGLSATGSAALAASPPPGPVRPTARDPHARRVAIRALSPRGAAFVTAWAATPTGRGGFASGAVGSGYDAGGGSTGWATGGGGDCGTGGGDGGASSC